VDETNSLSCERIYVEIARARHRRSIALGQIVRGRTLIGAFLVALALVGAAIATVVPISAPARAVESYSGNAAPALSGSK
jgi:hypothetical protein